MRARRVLNTKLRECAVVECVAGAAYSCSSFVCEFVCEVHGDVLARTVGRSAREERTAAWRRIRGRPPASSVTDSHGSPGVGREALVKTIYIIHMIYVFGRTLSRTPSAASNAFPTGVRRTALWRASTMTGGTRLFSSARSSGFCATCATTRAANEFSTKE